MGGKRRPMDVNLSVVEDGGGKHWTKKEIEQREAQEPKLPKPKALTPPEWMSADGKKLFRKYSKMILDFPSGLVSKLDTGTLARYCDCEISYAQASNHKTVWMETASRRLQDLAEAAEAKGVATQETAHEGYERELNAQTAYSEAEKQVDFWSGQMVKFEKIARSCATEMGMTVSSRCRLVVPKADSSAEKNPLDELLQRFAE